MMDTTHILKDKDDKINELKAQLVDPPLSLALSDFLIILIDLRFVRIPLHIVKTREVGLSWL